MADMASELLIFTMFIERAAPKTGHVLASRRVPRQKTQAEKDRMRREMMKRANIRSTLKMADFKMVNLQPPNLLNP